MAGEGVTELILRVKADASGLAALAQQFESIEQRIVSAAGRAQSAIKSTGGGGGSAELQRMRSQLDEVTAALRTQGAAQDSLSQKVDDTAKRRTRASADTKKAIASEKDEMEALAQTETRVTQMILADKVKLAGEMRSLATRRTADNIRAAEGMAEAETKATQMVLAAQMKLQAEMNRLRQERMIGDARAAEAKIAAEARAAVASGAAAQRSQMIGLSQASTAALQAEAAAQRELHSAARGLAGGLGMLWTTYGAFLPLIAGFALSAGLKKAIDLGTEFGYQLKFVGVVSQATSEEMSKMNTEFMRLGETSQFSSTEVARGARTLAQAGFTASQALQIMPELLRFSTLGEIELAHGAEIASGQMHAFGLEVKDIPHILDSTAKAAQISQTTISEMGGALRQSSSVAQQYGVSIDEMNALLAVLAQRNIRGTAAGTALRNMMVEMDPHTQRGKRAFDALGIAVYDASGRMKPIIPLMEEFANKFAKFDQQSQNRLSSDFFNERGAKAFLTAMAGAHGELQKFFEEIHNSDGTLKRNAEQINDTFKVQGAESVHAFENAFTEAFQSIEPELAKMLKGMKEFVQSEDFKTGLKDVASGFMLIATSLAAIVELLGKVGKMAVPPVLQPFASMGHELGNGVADWIDVFQGRGAGIFATGQNGMPTAEEIFAARARRESRERLAQAEARRSNMVSDFRQSEAANLSNGGNLGYGNYATQPAPSLVYNRDAGKNAWDNIQDENRRYREMEQVAKSHFANMLTMLRTDHDARLATDDEFNAREAALIESHYADEQGRTASHIARLTELRRSADKDKQNDIDTEIARSRLELIRQRESMEVKAYQDLGKEIKHYTDIGTREIEQVEKKNEATRSEIAALYSLDGAQKSATVQTLDATLKTMELARAKLLAAAASETEEQAGSAESLMRARGISEMDREIAKLKDLRGVTVQLERDKKEAQNDWLVGAISGLNHYLDHSMSTAHAVEEAFKKGFSAMEDALVTFVKTGKFNFKSFITSIADDFLRLLIRMNVTQPMAMALRNSLAGGFGGGAGGGAGGGFSLTGALSGASNLFGGLAGGAWDLVGQGVSGLGGTLLGSGISGAANIGMFSGFSQGLSGIMGGGGASMASSIGMMLPAIGTALMVGYAIYQMLSKPGGPKDGGSFMGNYGSAGNLLGNMNVPGTDNGRFFTPGAHDTELQGVTGTLAQSYASIIRGFGLTPGNASFGLGYDTDPNGTAPNRISSDVFIGGRSIRSSRDRAVGRDPAQLQTELTNETARMLLAALRNSDLPTDIRHFFDSLSDTATSEAINGVVALAQAYHQLNESLKPLDTGELIANASRSVGEILQTQGQSLLDFASSADFTTENIQHLTQATGEFAQAAASLILEVERVKVSINDMFQSTIRDLTLGGLDSQGQYNFYQNEAQSMYQRAMGSSDPQEVERLMRIVNSDIMSAFNLLSPEQQSAQRADYIFRADNTNTMIQQHLTSVQNTVRDEANTFIREVKEAMKEAADKFVAAAGAQQSAADTQLDAAHVSQHRTITIHVDQNGQVSLVTDGG